MKRDHKIYSIALLFLSLALILTSCGGGGGGGGDSAGGGVGGSTSGPPFIAAEVDSFPTGSVPPGLLPSGFNSLASVFVIDFNSGAPITDAAVTMNGVTLTYNATNQDYEGNLMVAPGASVTPSVTVGGNTFTASGTQFTTYPVISAPVSGAAWPASIANTVMWSGGTPTTTAQYDLGVLDAGNGQLIWPSSKVIQTLPIGTTVYPIPSNSLTAGNRLVIVGIDTIVAISGAAPGSVFFIAGFNYVPITVTNATLTSIVVSPTNPSIAKGTTEQFTATGTFSDSSTQDLTTQVAWSPSDLSIATINSNPGFQGLTYGAGVGSATITATLGNISGFTTLTVTPAVLVSIAVTPTNWAIPKGTTQQFTAMGTFSDSTLQDVTVSVIWSSSNMGVATISNTAGSNGKVTPISSGTTTITATSGSIMESTLLTVTLWTLRTSGATNPLSGVVWSGTQFLAVGYGYTIITSPDGTTWTLRSSSAATDGWSGVVWSGTQFVVVSNRGEIGTSPDGVTWTGRVSIGTYNFLSGVAWSGTQFVAVGSTILTSPDGVTWTQRTSGTANGLSGVTWSGTQFVAVGGSGTILTSPDGVTWTSRTSGTTYLLSGVAWSGTQFVAVGGASFPAAVSVILTSPDGITWTSQASGVQQALSGIAWSGTQFVAVGGEIGIPVDILTSPDGVTWTLQASGVQQALSDIAWSGTQFVAVGGQVYGEPSIILTSP